MTHLRKMMLEELQRRNYSEITTRKYLQYVTAFARHFGKPPDQLGPNELQTHRLFRLLVRCAERREASELRSPTLRNRAKVPLNRWGTNDTNAEQK